MREKFLITANKRESQRTGNKKLKIKAKKKQKDNKHLFIRQCEEPNKRLNLARRTAVNRLEVAKSERIRALDTRSDVAGELLLRRA